MNPILIGKHTNIQKIRELIKAISHSAFHVLILGETGVGKGVVACLLHHSSNRKDQRFIKINCAALPVNLLESELFGYDKGAFTGAVASKVGKFELASNGVIFLDEIGEMHPMLQAKLLQVIQSGEFTRLGGTREIKGNAWIIASTNRDLPKEMEQGRFREDLYYRLNTIRIEIPPLRDRVEDIPLLVAHFVKEKRVEYKISEPFAVNDEMMRLFRSYHWPGNVRELSSMILRLVLGESPAKLRAEIIHCMETGNVSDCLINSPFGAPGNREDENRSSATIRPLKAVKADAVRYIEKRLILNALRSTRWNKKKASEMLQLSYKALFYKIEAYEIAKPNNRRTLQR